jgi:hypothetical protein
LAETPISAVPYTISSPGVYYLANDIFSSANAKITISANNVLLDLQGRTLQSAATDECLLASGINITVRNGVLVNTVGGCIFLGARTGVIDHIIATSSGICTLYDQGGRNNRITHCVFVSGNVFQGQPTPYGEAPATVFMAGCGDLFEDNIVTSVRPGFWAIESANVGGLGSTLGNAIRNNVVRTPYAVPIQLDQFDTYSGNMFPGQPAGNANVSGGVLATD